jgi:hypothetical protein
LSGPASPVLVRERLGVGDAWSVGFRNGGGVGAPPLGTPETSVAVGRLVAMSTTPEGGFVTVGRSVGAGAGYVCAGVCGGTGWGACVGPGGWDGWPVGGRVGGSGDLVGPTVLGRVGGKGELVAGAVAGWIGGNGD